MNIDKIYIINLKERDDRWKKCIEQLSQYNITNYERFDAIIPDLNKIDPIQYSKNNMNINYKYIRGALGCKLSHIQIIIDANKNNYKQILILEDDFMFCNNFIDKYNDIILKIEQNKINIDMLYLGFSIVRENPYNDTEINNLKKITNGHTTHAYILNKSFYDTIINELKNCYCEIDICYANMQKKYSNIYGIYPCLITQQESYSNIMDRHVNYNKVIKLDNT